MNKKKNLRYQVYGNGESIYVDTLDEAYSLAYEMIIHFGHSFIYDCYTNKKIEEFFRNSYFTDR